MKIAIVGGTGALGSALALRLAAVGHTVRIGSRDSKKARGAALLIPQGAAGSGLFEAAAWAEVVFLTVPYEAVGETLAAIRGSVQGKIVVDTTVPLRPPKVGTVQLPPAGCAAVETAQALGAGVRVVSALQTIGADKLARGDDIDADVLVAGDDAEAVEVVRGLLGDLRLRSWHVGPLANSAAAEAMTSLLIQVNRRYKLAQAGVRITGRRRDAPPATRVSVLPVVGLPLFSTGDDLADAIIRCLAGDGERLWDGDVVVVAQKVVSKVEGRTRRLPDVVPGPAARGAAATAEKDAALVQLIIEEAQALVRVAPGVIIARHRTGHVLANAGIDASNIPGGDAGEVLLWPKDPGLSAYRLRAALTRASGAKVAVIISDSVGRAWRMGTTGTAIGSAGLRPLRDRRGERDLFGRELKATVVGVADEIAAAASLVMGEAAEGVPAAVVRGATYDPDDAAEIGEILRPREKDLFP
jgi:coenzyme F420-0:L-glutamate ligase/NADPH-dependent F420 reductase